MPEQVWPDWAVIRAMIAWNEKHGRPPRRWEWDKGADKTHPNSTTVLTRFGSWNAALEAAGLPIARRSRREWTRGEIIEALKADARVRGRPPTAREWKKATPTTPTNSHVYTLFGSWTALIVAAGFKPLKQGQSVGQKAA